MATPSQIAQRQRAIRSRHDKDAPAADQTFVPVSDVDEQSVQEIMDSYVARVGEPADWADIKTMEQVRYEIYKTRLAARDDARARGKLLPIEEVRARDEAKAAIFRRALQSVTDLVAKHAPPDRILEAQKEARAWIDNTLERVADEVQA